MVKKIFSGVLIGVLTLLIFSCTTTDGLNSSGTTSSSGGGTLSSGTLTDLPDVKVQLPNSLGGDAAMKMKMKGFKDPYVKPLALKPLASNDYDVFVPSTLQDVKSQGWKDMVDKVTRESQAATFVKMIRQYASNHTIPLDTDIALGTINMELYPGYFMEMDAGKIRVSKPDANTTDIYWKVVQGGMDDPMMAMGMTSIIYIYLKITENNVGNKKVEMVINYEFESDDPNMMMTGMAMPYMYSSYDEVGGEVVDLYYSSMVYEMPDYPEVGMTNYQTNKDYFMNSSKTDSEGGIEIFSRFGGSMMGESIIIAWGDDTKGGLVNRHQMIMQSMPTNNYIYTEYYNQDGNFLFKNWGSSGDMDYSWLDWYTYSGTNLADLGYTTPPETIVKISGWDTNTWDSYIIITNESGTAVVISNAWIWDIYFKSTSSWAPNDCVYWMESSEWNDETYMSIETYKIGYKVPALQTYFGDQYYLENTWAMKYLTLAPAYSNYSITRYTVDETSYTNIWENWYYLGDTNFVETVTNIYTWGEYDWWLDASNNTQFDTNDDIKLRNLREEEVWIWDPQTWQVFKQKGLFVSATELTPMYFNFTEQAKVDAVNTKITAIYNNKLSFNIDTYTNTLAQMPAKSKFPQ